MEIFLFLLSVFNSNNFRNRISGECGAHEIMRGSLRKDASKVLPPARLSAIVQKQDCFTGHSI
jgi:hypothetical protein